MSKEEFVFARPPNELSCIIGSLFAELNAPCEHICKMTKLFSVALRSAVTKASSLSGTTAAGSMESQAI